MIDFFPSSRHHPPQVDEVGTSVGSPPITLLGVDPGTRITGYGLIEVSGSAIRPLDFGAIRPPVDLPPAEKYLVIFDAILALLERFEPQAVAVETQFVGRNVQSALKLGMARGAVLIASARCKIPVHEYAPTKAKQAVVGHGGASKEQVQKMLQMLLRLPCLPEPEDAADALALAICHSHQMRSYV